MICREIILPDKPCTSWQLLRDSLNILLHIYTKYNITVVLTDYEGLWERLKCLCDGKTGDKLSGSAILVMATMLCDLQNIRNING